MKIHVNWIKTPEGNAIEEGLANTPELRRYLRMIPIAGSLIESQLCLTDDEIKIMDIDLSNNDVGSGIQRWDNVDEFVDVVTKLTGLYPWYSG